MTKVIREDKETLLTYLRQMYEIRYFEEKVMELLAQNIITGASHLYAGEEAVAVGACAAIEPTDSNAARPGRLELLESDTILGARVGPNVVLFSRDGRALSSGSARLAAAGTVRLVVGDLEPGKAYTLTVASAAPALKRKAGPAGTIFAGNVEVPAAGRTVTIRKDR